MPSKGITPIDIFQALSAKEKRQVLAMLRKEEQTPCERLGHKYRPGKLFRPSLFAPILTKFICERCGKSFVE